MTIDDALEHWARWVRNGRTRIGYPAVSNFGVVSNRLKTGVIPQRRPQALVGYDELAERVDGAIQEARRFYNLPQRGRKPGHGDRMLMALKLDVGAYDNSVNRLTSRSAIAERLEIDRVTLHLWLRDMRRKVEEMLNA